MKRLPYILLASLTLLFSCGGEDSKDDPVLPQAPSDIILSTSSISAEREGGEYSLTVTAPVRPSLKSDSSWVTVSDGTYSDYKITYTIRLEANGDYEERSAVLSVSSGELKKTLSVTQKGREKPSVNPTDISKSLVTDGASDGASALYDYLLGIYGKKMLSSVIADVNWNTTIAESVHARCGSYPAMNCFDFIHVYVDGSWIDYDDISPVTKWHDAGGIVSLMWHFNVPLSETTTVGSDGSGVTCTASSTTFKASNAMVEGSWENKWYKANMEKVADIILKLQEKGIAAIWRPYHEAAGNSYALKWKGSAWFWWGSEGPEVFKALWNDMFETFASKGIRNLIWVWTAQNHNGDASSYDSDEEWYPGDDKVDVVARDIYGSTEAQVVLDFVELQNAYPHKMIALGECGRGDSGEFPGIDGIWKAGGAYSWFMPWYSGGFTMVSEDWWKAAFASEYIVSREELPAL